MIFIDACKRKQTPYTPIWMMRQAGRYLEEYKEVRKEAGSFLELCHNSTLAAKVTLQPIDILDVDAAIIFSDILVVPLEMGMPLEFLAGEGPKFSSRISNEVDIKNLQIGIYKNLTYVYDTLSKVRHELSSQKALIGFCGSAWTLATYMIEGEGSKTYTRSKKMLYKEPKLLHMLLQKITDELKGYLEMQIKAGADAVMVFDSWAGALEKEAYFEFSWKYMKEIASHLKKKFPEVPVILFPKGIVGYLDCIDGDFDVFGVDWGSPMQMAKHYLGERYVLQGNLEPSRLYDRESMEKGVDEIIAVMGKKEGHIFNLGHGMLPDLPRENAIALVQMVREKTKR
ncbi:uroporphyrinogen decarboxylase [Helicobacter cappadocius]|uniref:Uroporphyrinogen decarboxylase n=1 Tax=Helicobacter cappadocius TaxID=3063998 RepID=A0AA90PQU1_9HELI|nr:MULTISPECIES: uroporphyrinogen decarboxylase [unclassified Helicobacter]MDO7253324.1 uroporphyrinogen decarboxylase [Helicobacter sp. faydin-H75]MDP2539246.1 uroporphyrinogen decarboxylase [Helicobacter sp. faydin-H76]